MAAPHKNLPPLGTFAATLLRFNPLLGVGGPQDILDLFWNSHNDVYNTIDDAFKAQSDEDTYVVYTKLRDTFSNNKLAFGSNGTLKIVGVDTETLALWLQVGRYDLVDAAFGWGLGAVATRASLNATALSLADNFFLQLAATRSATLKITETQRIKNAVMTLNKHGVVPQDSAFFPKMTLQAGQWTEEIFRQAMSEASGTFFLAKNGHSLEQKTPGHLIACRREAAGVGPGIWTDVFTDKAGLAGVPVNLACTYAILRSAPDAEVQKAAAIILANHMPKTPATQADVVQYVKTCYNKGEDPYGTLASQMGYDGQTVVERIAAGMPGGDIMTDSVLPRGKGQNAHAELDTTLIQSADPREVMQPAAYPKYDAVYLSGTPEETMLALALRVTDSAGTDAAKAHALAAAPFEKGGFWQVYQESNKKGAAVWIIAVLLVAVAAAGGFVAYRKYKSRSAAGVREVRGN